MKRFIVLGFVAMLSGCSSTTTDLETSPGAVRAEGQFSESYQEIYRRIASSAKSCVSANIGTYTSFEIDSDLYNELGYGEVTMSLQNMASRNYYWRAKIEKVGTGSRLSVTAGNTLSKDSMLRDVVGWANGGTVCTNR